MRRRALLVFIISMCTDCICRLQEISGWTNNRITQTLRKGVCVCAFFFGLKSKTESREVFICVLLFLPCDSLQLKNKTLLWPLWSRTLQQPGRGLLKNWEYVSWLFVFLLFFIFFFILILKVILERFHRLWDLISLAALRGENGSSRAAFWLFTWN